MISRLTASAAVFAFLVTTGLAVASDARSQRATAAATAAAATMPMVTLPRVEITGHRIARR
jgi:hypothetical protein